LLEQDALSKQARYIGFGEGELGALFSKTNTLLKAELAGWVRAMLNSWIHKFSRQTFAKTTTTTRTRTRTRTIAKNSIFDRIMTMATAVYKNKIMFADAEATTLDDARSELAYIFQYNQDDLCDDRSHVTHTALALLATWPALAYDEFHADEDVDYTFLPLSIFVAAGADLTIISL